MLKAITSSRPQWAHIDRAVTLPGGVVVGMGEAYTMAGPAAYWRATAVVGVRAALGAFCRAAGDYFSAPSCLLAALD
jgi:lysozyme family protein